MTTLILDTEYSINLAGSYFVDSPVLKEDWLCICLYYNQVTGVLETGARFNQELIKFIDFPFSESFKHNYTGKLPFELDEVTLNLIRYATENNFHFLPNIEDIDRDTFLNLTNTYLPASIPNLKKSFLTFDLLKNFIVKNSPTLGGKLSTSLETKLIEFKKSDLGIAFREGINETIERYSDFYYVTLELEAQLKNDFIYIQQEFLGKLDFEKIKSFDISSFIEDGIGTAIGLVIPFFPLGTIKELFNFTKTNLEFKQNKRLQFILSIFYLQKILSQEIKSTGNINHCVICQTTEVEINNLSDEDINLFVFKNTQNMCHKHMVSYLNARKFGQLMGKSLLLSMKT